MSTLTHGQLNALTITERVNSSISLLGIFFILITYTFYPFFNKPINRLIFFATWANLGTCVASLISIDGLANASLCRFQAFLVQMFLGVDAYWALCMAINVYLAFFKGYTVEQLRALDMRYLLACYGLSFVPAFVFIFINSPWPIYGNAVIWCWVSSEWVFLRLIVLYAIVWVALLLSLIVYIMAARVIYKKRDQLEGFLNPWNESPFTNIITTEIRITTEDNAVLTRAGPRDEGQPAGFELENEPSATGYAANVEVGHKPSQGIVPAALNIRNVTRDIASNEANAESWLYARVAFLFFFALAITWIPASANRIYNVIHPHGTSFSLNYLSSFVFPLQGFWNAIVYIWTSRTACSSLWASLWGRSTGLVGVGSRLGSRKGFKIGSPREDAFGQSRRASRIGRGKGIDGDVVMIGTVNSRRDRYVSVGSSGGRSIGNARL